MWGVLMLAAPARADDTPDEVLDHDKLLANQLGDVEVHCDQPGVTVTLDSEPLLACPGTQARRVAPGRHQIVGRNDGFFTKTTEVVVRGGTREPVALALIPISSATTIVHRWPTWEPWLVFGGGLTMIGIGGLLEYQSSQDMSSYDHALTLACGATGCDASRPIPPYVTDQKLRATRENNIAVGVLSVGFATAAVGGVLLYLNRGREVNPVLEHVGRVLDRFDVSSTPGGGMFALRGHF